MRAADHSSGTEASFNRAPDKPLLRLAGSRRLLGLAVLTILAAVTEGIGLLLLVPLLSALSGQGLTNGGLLGRALAMSPVKPGLGGLLVAFVILIALRGLLQMARNVASVSLERRIVEGLRTRGVSALLRADWRKLGTLRSGEALSLLVSGIDRTGFAVHELVALAGVLLLIGAAFLAALALSATVALGALVGGALVVLAYGPVRKHALALGRKLGRSTELLNGQLTETLGALRVVKSFSAEQRTAAKLDAVDRSLTADRIGFQTLAGLSQALLQTAGAGALALLVWLAATHWGVDLVILLPLIALFARMLPLLGAVQQHWSIWLNTRPVLDETLRLISELEGAAEPVAAIDPLPRPRRSIGLERATVLHPGRALAALDSVSLTLPVSTTTVLLGPSGAGKSTVADLLGGLIAADDGGLVLDGRTLSPEERIAWRAQVAYVQQEPVLFNMTVRENLLWAAPDAGQAQLERALADASAQFVLSLPRGLETTVGDSGRQLSGGERQRIVLARALLREPALLILDETTSALDSENERAIADAVARMRGRLTILIIGHRGALTGLADRQIRLDAGRMVAVSEAAA